MYIGETFFNYEYYHWLKFDFPIQPVMDNGDVKV